MLNYVRVTGNLMFSGKVNVYPCCGSSVQRQGSDAKEFLANPLTHLRWLTVESRRQLCDGYTVEPLFYDHLQNQIGVVVKQGWSYTRGLLIL